MTRRLFATTFAAAVAAFGSLPSPASADDAQVARGRYLVVIAGCSDCHTPGALLGAPDMKRYLGGSDVGFAIPGMGVFVGENLTPDKETGLGDWTSEQIIAAIRTGKTPEGKDLSPVMPYAAFCAPHRLRRRGHRRLSQEPSAGQQQGQEFRPERARHGQRLRRAAARRLQRAAGAAEIAAGAAGDHFGRKSRPTPLLTN